MTFRKSWTTRIVWSFFGMAKVGLAHLQYGTGDKTPSETRRLTSFFSGARWAYGITYDLEYWGVASFFSVMLMGGPFQFSGRAWKTSENSRRRSISCFLFNFERQVCSLQSSLSWELHIWRIIFRWWKFHLVELFGASHKFWIKCLFQCPIFCNRTSITIQWNDYLLLRRLMFMLCCRSRPMMTSYLSVGRLSNRWNA